MRIRMRTTAAGPDLVLMAGMEAEVSDDFGMALVQGGYAEDLAPQEGPPEKRKTTRAEVLRRKAAGSG